MSELEFAGRLNMSLVISGFPGVGKTHYYNAEKELKVSDSDSSQFNKNDFPNNYIQHIKKLIKQEYDVILVSSHESVRRELNKEKISHVVVMPRTDEKAEYIRRYKERGSSADFIDMMASSWDMFMNSMHISYWDNQYGAMCFLNPGQYLDKIIVDALVRRGRIKEGQIKTELILQEDDCASDAYEYFGKNMREITGMSVEDFQSNPNSVYLDEGLYSEHSIGDLILSFSGDDPYYRLERVIKEEEGLPDDICMCDCHRVGLAGFYHCFGLVCCEHENEQYLETPTKPVDLESGRKAFGEHGVLNVELYREMIKRKEEGERVLNRKRKNKI